MTLTFGHVLTSPSVRWFLFNHQNLKFSNTEKANWRIEEKEKEAKKEVDLILSDLSGLQGRGGQGGRGRNPVYLRISLPHAHTVAKHLKYSMSTLCTHYAHTVAKNLKYSTLCSIHFQCKAVELTCFLQHVLFGFLSSVVQRHFSFSSGFFSAIWMLTFSPL